MAGRLWTAVDSFNLFKYYGSTKNATLQRNNVSTLHLYEITIINDC